MQICHAGGSNSPLQKQSIFLSPRMDCDWRCGGCAQRLLNLVVSMPAFHSPFSKHSSSKNTALLTAGELRIQLPLVKCCGRGDYTIPHMWVIPWTGRWLPFFLFFIDGKGVEGTGSTLEVHNEFNFSGRWPSAQVKFKFRLVFFLCLGSRNTYRMFWTAWKQVFPDFNMSIISLKMQLWFATVISR